MENPRISPALRLVLLVVASTVLIASVQPCALAADEDLCAPLPAANDEIRIYRGATPGSGAYCWADRSAVRPPYPPWNSATITRFASPEDARASLEKARQESEAFRRANPSAVTWEATQQFGDLGFEVPLTRRGGSVWTTGSLKFARGCYVFTGAFGYLGSFGDAGGGDIAPLRAVALAADAKLKTYECGTRPDDPTFTLDRVEGPRFAAVKLNGKGFRPNSVVTVYWDDKDSLELSAHRDGTIPDSWIWVPDAVHDGTNRVHLKEVGSSGRKSTTLDFNVTRVSRSTLLGNINGIIRIYLDRIASNPDEHIGWVNNLKWQLYLNPKGGTYRCGDYQDSVLRMLNGIRFSNDLQTRALMDGIDYTSMFSGGTSWYSLAWHAFVVAWPHGPALEPGALDTPHPTWQDYGISLDPWISQGPQLYEMAPGAKGWAYDDRLRHAWGYLTVSSGERVTHMPYIRCSPSSWIMPGYDGLFPSTGGAYYQNFADYSNVAANVPQLQEAPANGIITESPVKLEVDDVQGRRIFLGKDGKLVNQIPGAFALAQPKPGAPGYTWYVSLPPGDFGVKITAIADGAYQLRTRAVNQALKLYPRVSVTTGDTAEMKVSDKPGQPKLTTGRGESFSPVPFTPPYAAPEQGPFEKAGGGGGGTPALEADTDRYGGDYRNVDLPEANPELCRQACERDARCKAFTFVKPGRQAAGARCWLKETVPPARANDCCMSGLKTGVREDERRRPGEQDPNACGHFLGSGIHAKWMQTGGERGLLGCPTISESEAGRSPQGTTGRYSKFSARIHEGAITWHRNGARAGCSFETHGEIYRLYSSMGGTTSWLGFPVSDEYSIPGGRRSDFEGGSITWDARTGRAEARKPVGNVGAPRQ